MNVCMIGTGYVGLVTGTCLAEIGHNVICADVDREKIQLLNSGEVPIFEPGLQELIHKNTLAHRLAFMDDIQQAVQQSTVVYIAVGTPPDKDGQADLSYVFQAAKDIAKALNGYKVIVDKSTVPVGTAKKVREIIDKNKTRNVDFAVVSNPEFLKEGSAIQDVFEGDRIVIGTDDDKARDIMKKIYEPLDIPMFFTDVASAEMIKYASNAFLATKISFINEIANLCEYVGADVTKVALGMGMDKRIGKSFLNAGLGYGGSCFPKDVSAIAMTAKEAGYHFQILDAVMKVNESQRQRLVQKVFNKIGHIANPVIGILGLSFKPNTDDIREAPSVYIIKQLKKKGVKIKAYDPMAMENMKKVIQDIEYCDNLYQTCDAADAVVIVTEWDEFKKMDLVQIKNMMKTPLIVDGRNIFECRSMREMGFDYVSIGRK